MENGKSRMTRREFSAASINALFVGMGVTLVGCGGGGGGSDYVTGPSATSGGTPAATPPPSPTSSADKTGSISANHGHAAVVKAAQLQAGGAVMLDIQGTADHSHGLDLSAEQVRQIAAGARVSKSTTASGTRGEYGSYEEHEHTVTFN